jgi:hypothetical protein
MSFCNDTVCHTDVIGQTGEYASCQTSMNRSSKISDQKRALAVWPLPAKRQVSEEGIVERVSATCAESRVSFCVVSWFT